MRFKAHIEKQPLEKYVFRRLFFVCRRAFAGTGPIAGMNERLEGEDLNWAETKVCLSKYAVSS